MNKKGTIPMLLTGVSVIASIAAVVFAIRETPNATEIISHHKDNPDATTKDKVVDYAKGYWRTGICLGVSTAASIASCAISNSRYKELIKLTASSTAALGTAYTKYKDKVKDIVGEEKASMIDKLYKDSFCNEKIWFQESVSGEFFQATWKDIYEAEYEANKRVNLEGKVLLGDIFEDLRRKAPKTSKWGWTSYMLLDDYGYPWIDFVHRKKNGPALEDGGIDFNFNDGRETYVINYGIWPVPENTF